MIQLRKKLPGDKALVCVNDEIRVVDISGLDIADDISNDYSQELQRELMWRFDNTQPKRKPEPPALAAEDQLKIARRKKLRENAAEITKARDRGFAESDKYVPSKGLELARQTDAMFVFFCRQINALKKEIQFISGKGQELLYEDPDDKLWMRDWWEGDQDYVSFDTWAKSMSEAYKLRQLLRQLEQEGREQIAAIFKDESKSIDQRIKEIEAIEIEPNLGLKEHTDITEVREHLKSKRASRGVTE